jgi:hypothetical protein
MGEMLKAEGLSGLGGSASVRLTAAGGRRRGEEGGRWRPEEEEERGKLEDDQREGRSVRGLGSKA